VTAQTNLRLGFSTIHPGQPCANPSNPSPRPFPRAVSLELHHFLSSSSSSSPSSHPEPAMQHHIWVSTIPLHITHPSSPVPYLIRVPRLSYLPLLLPRLTTFFGPASSFSYQSISLNNLPVGLLYDLYQPSLPWRLELGQGPLFDIHDTYINSVKEVQSQPSALSLTRTGTDLSLGGLYTQWHCKGHNVHVEGKLHATMELRARQYVHFPGDGEKDVSLLTTRR